jgi:uncharacterized repeat protein (TIGR03803 family)
MKRRQGFQSWRVPVSATVQTLVDFNGTDGSQPQYVNLLIDANGDLFGTTEHGGPGGYGTVFEITDSALTGYASTPTTLATFTNSTGENPYSGLLMDAQGNLFGTTVGGGDSNFGTAFEISFMPTTGYSNTPTTIAIFLAPVYRAAPLGPVTYSKSLTARCRVIRPQLFRSSVSPTVQARMRA